MKVFFSFFFLLFLVFFISCENEVSNEANNLAQGQVTEKKMSKRAKGLPAPRKMRKSKLDTKSRIDVINGRNVRSSQGPILVEGIFFSIAGWAIDFPAKKNAAGVYIVIDDKTFASTYGVKRSGLKDLLGNEKYVNAGFSAKIPVSKVGNGDHKVNIMVVSANRKAYFVNPSQEVSIRVE